MNLPVLVFSIILLVALIIFLIIRNHKDQKELENQLNNDYKDATDSPDDIETDEKLH